MYAFRFIAFPCCRNTKLWEEPEGTKAKVSCSGLGVVAVG
jgi:hypothetical protein